MFFFKKKIIFIIGLIIAIFFLIDSSIKKDKYKGLIQSNYYNENVGLMLPNDHYTENGQLFLSELLILKGIKKQINETDVNNFIKLMENTRISKGLFNRRKDEKKCRTMSHDNITGIMMASYQLNLNYHKEIFDYLTNNYMIYDNCKKHNINYIFHPAQYYPWAVVNNHGFYEFISLPFYIINMLYGSIFSYYSNTSTKILYFFELYTIRNTNIVNYGLYNIYSKIMKFRYGENYLQKLMEIYFWQDNNYPLRLYSQDLDKLI